MTGRFAPCLVISFGLVVCGVAEAQTRATTADLSGTVYDQSKGVLPGVTITVTNVDTGVSRTSLTDGAGRYVMLALPPGTYRVLAELAGFQPQHRDGVELALGTAVDLSLTLSVAGAAEQVTLTYPGMFQSVTVWAVADDDGTGGGKLNECLEDNNSAPMEQVCIPPG